MNGTFLPPVVCATDGRFILPVCVLMESLAASQRGHLDRLRFVVLFEDLGAGDVGRLRFHARRLGLRLELRRTARVDGGLPVSNRITRATYLRLQIGDVFPDEPRVLYLDADMVVLKDLRPLLTRPGNGLPLAAVLDPTDVMLKYADAMPGWRDLGLPGDREYFNAGLMLLDLDVCESSRLFERAHEFLLKYPECARYHDQDALNWAAEDRWTRLEAEWNVFTMSTIVARPDFVHRAEPVLPLRSLLDLEPHAAILHYSGRNKPWQPACPDTPVTRLYRRYMARVTAHDRDCAPPPLPAPTDHDGAAVSG